MMMESSNRALAKYTGEARATLSSNSSNPARSLEIAKETKERNLVPNSRKASNSGKAYIPSRTARIKYRTIRSMVSADTRAAIKNRKRAVRECMGRHTNNVWKESVRYSAYTWNYKE